VSYHFFSFSSVLASLSSKHLLSSFCLASCDQLLCCLACAYNVLLISFFFFIFSLFSFFFLVDGQRRAVFDQFGSRVLRESVDNKHQTCIHLPRTYSNHFFKLSFSSSISSLLFLVDGQRRAVFDQFGSRALKEGIDNGHGGVTRGWTSFEDPLDLFATFFGTASPFATVSNVYVCLCFCVYV